MNNKYLASLATLMAATIPLTATAEKYPCVPYADAVTGKITQTIPGRIQNEYFDMLAPQAKQQAEGKCFHDTDTVNNGSGKLNKPGSYLTEFRMGDAPDISYTKLNNADVAVDDSTFNLIQPEGNSLYLGWISPGEWVNYTVTVKQTGFYSVSAQYTSKFGGHIAFEVNGKDVSAPLEIPSTFNINDHIEWRQAHHWNRTSGLGKIHLKKGKQVLRLKFLDQSVMNFDYMDFEKIK